MKIRTRIYSLRNIGDKTILSIDLMRFIVFEDTTLIKIQFPSGVKTFNKYQYVNKNRVIQVENHAFLLASKHLHNDCALKWLLNHEKSKRLSSA